METTSTGLEPIGAMKAVIDDALDAAYAVHGLSVLNAGMDAGMTRDVVAAAIAFHVSRGHYVLALDDMLRRP